MRDWVLRWLAKWGLLSNEKASLPCNTTHDAPPALGALDVDGGSGNVQVGAAAGQVVVNQITYHVQTMHTSMQPPVSGQDSVFGAEMASTRPRTVVSNEQRSVLQLMKRTGCESVVLNWMEKEMHTRRVVELQPKQLYRVQRYCETIIERAQIKQQVEMGR